MRMRGYAMRSSSNKVMRMRSVLGITLLLELRMRTTSLRMRIIDLEEFFENSREIGQKTEFIPARPDHQNVKKNQKIFLSENRSQ